MSKKLLPLLLLATFLLAGGAQAQTNDLPEPGMLPDSPFYFLKRWFEDVGTFFTFGEVNKTRRLLRLSEKRLAEANALVAKGKAELAEKVVGKYQEQIAQALVRAEEARAKGLEVDEVLAKISEATLKHQEVLADVYEKVPEQAKPAIKQAMEAGMRGHEEALKAVSGQKREEVVEKMEQKRQEVEQKLEELRDKGIPIPTIPTREEIEEQVPSQPLSQPEVKKPEVPGQLKIQEPRPKHPTEKVEVEELEVPEMEAETPGGGSKPETGKPEIPGRP